MKRFVIMMARGHGGMACMAQECHGDGDVDSPIHKISNASVIDVDGPICKIGNASVIDVDDWKACYTRKETRAQRLCK
jgi:hypothetical protein